MAYTPLASRAQFTATPWNALVSDMTTGEVDNLMLRASRSIESLCRRRLAPFSDFVEQHRARGVRSDAVGDGYIGDKDVMIGQSRAASLGVYQQSREVFLNEYPPIFDELWTGALSAVTLTYPFGGTATLTGVSGFEFDPARGWMRLPIGVFVPAGTTISVTYSGGYATIPDDLSVACMYEAARIALLELMPQDDDVARAKDLKAERDDILVAYRRDTNA